MGDQEHQQAHDQPAEEPSTRKDRVDLTALTAAVERLLRRDLEIARERTRDKRRRSGWR